jgi:DNA-binding MarR family transcriptional regulator
MSETTVYTRRDVAKAARLFGQENELDGFGKRGRVSENLVLSYLQALPAKSVREIAADLGVEIPAKGKISEAEFLSVSGHVARNAPKATEGE